MARGKELTGRIPPIVHDALSRVAEAYNTTMNAILTEALIEHLGSKYGLTVRPLSAQNGITLVETTWAHRAPTERPECAPAAPNLIPPSAHVGDIGGSLSMVNQERETNQERDGGVGVPLKKKRKATDLTPEQLARFDRLYLHKAPDLDSFWPFDRDDRATAEKNWRIHAEPCTDADVDGWIGNIEAQARKRQADQERDGFLPKKRGASRYFNGKTWRERPEVPPPAVAEPVVDAAHYDWRIRPAAPPAPVAGPVVPAELYDWRLPGTLLS